MVMTNEAMPESIEQPFAARGAGAIFHIKSTDQYMFFLRDDKETIPFPNMVDIIGGHMDPGETPGETAMREFGEELEDNKTGEPFQPDNITHFKTWVDDRNVEQNIFVCELEEVPNLKMNEGQGLVFLSRDDLATTDFAFNYKDVVLEYARDVELIQKGWEILKGEDADKVWPGAVRVEQDTNYREIAQGGEHFFAVTAEGKKVEILNGFLYDPDDGLGGILGTQLE